MENLVTLKELGLVLRKATGDEKSRFLLNEQNTGYSLSTCYTIDKDGRTLGRIITAYNPGNDGFWFMVAVNGKPRVFKTLNAVEKALSSIDVESFTVHVT